MIAEEWIDVASIASIEMVMGSIIDRRDLDPSFDIIVAGVLL
jgi:hypothetical protein